MSTKVLQRTLTTHLRHSLLDDCYTFHENLDQKGNSGCHYIQDLISLTYCYSVIGNQYNTQNCKGVNNYHLNYKSSTPVTIIPILCATRTTKFIIQTRTRSADSCFSIAGRDLILTCGIDTKSDLTS